MDQFINHWHVPGWPWRTNYRGCGLSPQRSSLIFWMTIAWRGVPPGWSEVYWIPLGQHSQLGQGGRLRWKWWWVLCRKVIEPLQMPLWKSKLRQGDQDIPEEHWRQVSSPQQPTTLKSGSKAWRKILSKQGWEMTKWVIVGLSRRMLILISWAGVEDSVEDKVPHDYWQKPPVYLPPQEGEFKLGKQTKYSSINHDKRV